jgi:NhaP-type Na+/H+ or K+/H+ antiporter
MNARTALGNLQSLAQPLILSWPVFAFGIICGLLLGVLGAALAARRRRRSGKRGIIRSFLSLTPAVVACVLWGLWLGILAAKSLAP